MDVFRTAGARKAFEEAAKEGDILVRKDLYGRD
jgi:hypothetical protein